MTTSMRNLGAAPDLKSEGVFLKPLKIPPNLPLTADWSKGMSPYQRLCYHQTLASCRRYTHFKALVGLIPDDSLDFVLNAKYDHGEDLFGEKGDVVFQCTTFGTDKRIKMRNTLELSKAQDAISMAISNCTDDTHKRPDFAGSIFGKPYDHSIKKPKKSYEKYNDFHVLHVGGITERRHPCNVKLMNSSHHSPQTNAGYSRQDSDGNAYQY